MKTGILSIVLIFCGLIIITVIGCSKKDNNNPTDFRNDMPNDSNLKNLPQNDTLGFKYLNSEKLINCMLINDIKLKKDSFLIKSEAELHGNLTGTNCINSLPQINLRDSMIIGYTSRIGGSGYSNDERMFTYNRAKNTLTYSFTIYTNDTSLLTTELNWIAIPKYDIDSINFKVKVIRK